jgi:hypothetical protein
MYTDYIFEHLKKATILIGQELHSFCNWTHEAFTCKELSSEYNQHQKKRQKQKEIGKAKKKKKEKR